MLVGSVWWKQEEGGPRIWSRSQGGIVGCWYGGASWKVVVLEIGASAGRSVRGILEVDGCE
jgi:hypothetical protein